MKTAIVLLAILAWPLTLMAAPFLVCDPYTGADYFVVSGLPDSINGNVQPDSTGKYGFMLDIQALPVGNYTVTAQACSNTWGCSAATSPLAFSRPDLSRGPTNIRLSK